MVITCRECVNSRFNFDWRNSHCVLLDGQHDPKDMYGDEPPSYCPRQTYVDALLGKTQVVNILYRKENDHENLA